ncbi:MAG: aromatic ring-hydroxylating dioxygenase subunit alpha [Pseudomonadota bacterium]|nr:aromatic ring-hydroxylating dioxygenase subunit alpha [Pseudomonadota bacterium]
MFLKNLWYFAHRGDQLKRSSMVSKTLLGKTILIARDADGLPFAVQDICPHRGIPLSKGTFDGREIKCCYHGWSFNREGRCTAIPSLVEDQKFNVERVRVHRYPCREVQGIIWIYFGDETNELIEPPKIPEIGDRRPNTAFTMPFPCHVDHAVIGLMDPAHGPFVHRAWWWRSGSSIHEKTKAFAPAERGFKMVRHPPSSNSAAYKLLGGDMTTEISFQLPSVRIEHIRAGEHVLCGLTAVTPINETETELNHLIYWTQPWLTPLTPLLRPFVRAFLKQDRDILIMQQEGLKHAPKLMLINDADMQAKWYYRLKESWAESTVTGAPFENPVKAKKLRWRS